MLMAEYSICYRPVAVLGSSGNNNSGNNGRPSFTTGPSGSSYNVPQPRVAMYEPLYQLQSYSRHEHSYRRRPTKDIQDVQRAMFLPHSQFQHPTMMTGGFLPPPPPPQSVKYTKPNTERTQMLRQEIKVKYVERLPIIPGNDTYLTQGRVIRSEQSHGLPITTRGEVPIFTLGDDNVCREAIKLPPISIQNEPVKERTVGLPSPVLESPPKLSPRSPKLYPLSQRTRSDDSESETECLTSGGPPAKRRDRGRPDADSVMRLQREGESSSSAIKCNFCSRVFPREKSLQAHVRTHKGVKPFICDYPSCPKAFVQSGQLKTHQRLHTGEKPFSCQVPDCETRFAHSGRHCSKHPQTKLIRRDDEYFREEITTRAEKTDDADIREWLKRYVRERITGRRERGQRLSRSDFGDLSPNPHQDEERPVSPLSTIEPTVTEAALALVELHHGNGR